MADTISQFEDIDLDSIKIPYLLKDMVLMAPGVWNDTVYTSESVTSAFKNTDWNDREVSSVFVDHSDKNILTWVGKIINPRLSGDKVYGDVAIYNKDAAVNVAVGKMRCGISPKVSGQEDENKQMSDFKFLNFSIVTNPACKKAYINLSQEEMAKNEPPQAGDAPQEVKDILKKAYASAFEQYKDQERASKIAWGAVKNAGWEKNKDGKWEKIKKQEEIIVTNPVSKEANINLKIERRLNMEGIENKEVTQELSIDSKTEKVEELKKQEAPKTELMKDSDVIDMLATLSVEELSEWTNFVNKYRKENPGASFKDIAAAFKGQKDMSDKLANLSDDEIVGQIEKLSAVLRKRKSSCSLEEKEKKMSQEIEKLQSTVKELDAKLNEPDRKTVKSMSSVNESIPQAKLSSSEMMMSFLKGNLK